MRHEHDGDEYEPPPTAGNDGRRAREPGEEQREAQHEDGGAGSGRKARERGFGAPSERRAILGARVDGRKWRNWQTRRS